MPSLIWVLFAWCLTLSLLEFVWCFYDKRAAKRGWRRLPEKRLLGFALLGGGPGLWLGMTLFRHKTRHWSFCLTAPLTTILWLGGLLWLAAGKVPVI